MRAGPAALCPGSVVHRRHRPAEHRFRHRTSHVWIDPDRPDELCDLSRWWSSRGPAPVRFRADDYGTAASGSDGPLSLGDQARNDLTEVLGHRPAGPVRMLSQLRRWGWLFNPITFFLAWDGDDDRPVGAVLEVTNTPWHERHRYAVALTEEGGQWRAGFDKSLHVSPFLDEDYRYQLAIADRDDRFRAALDVVDTDDSVVLSTLLDTARTPASRSAVREATLRPLLPTHRVTIGIHAQAVRLWRKGVPFVAHPGKRSRQPDRTRS